MSEPTKRMTAKLAKETVKASYPRACCRYGWITTDGVKREYYEVYPTLAVSGNFLGSRYSSPVVLAKAASKSEAWIMAAEKIIAKMGESR